MRPPYTLHPAATHTASKDTYSATRRCKHSAARRPPHTLHAQQLIRLPNRYTAQFPAAKVSAAVRPPDMLHPQQLNCLPKGHTAQLASANTEPQGDLHLRCMCINSHVHQKDTQLSAVIHNHATTTVRPPYTLHLAAIHTSSEETYSATRWRKYSAAERHRDTLHPAATQTSFEGAHSALARANTQLQGD